MIVAIQTERLETLEQVQGFVEGNAGVGFELKDRRFERPVAIDEHSKPAPTVEPGYIRVDTRPLGRSRRLQ